jgi:23S rRNA pseudouridine1911/1915/1917 synthase
VFNRLRHIVVKHGGERLDKVLHTYISDVSRVYVQSLIQEGWVHLDGKRPKPSEKTKNNSLIRLELPNTPQAEMPLQVLYEDDALIVVDKPPHVVVHHGTRHHHSTLLDMLAHHTAESDDGLGIVHRLDKETSGVMVVARTSEAMRDLNAQFEAHRVAKRYFALLEKHPQHVSALIDAPIGQDPRRKRMAVMPDGKPSQTQYTVIDTNFVGGQALIEVDLLTGRTHQIRVHMAHIGCPLVGDTVYSRHDYRLALHRHFLHAHSLSFEHPLSRQALSFTSPLPHDLQQLLDELR